MNKEKKKVLFLIHTLQIGGAEKVLVNLVNKLNQQKYDITVMTVINAGAFRKKLNKNIHYKTIFDIKFLSKEKESTKSNNQNSGNLFSKTSRIKNILASLYKFFWRNVNCEKIYNKYVKDDYDVEVAFLEGVASKIIANSTNKEAKKIAWLHVDLINETKTERFFKNDEDEKNNYHKFDKIVGVSKYVVEQAIKKYQLNPDKTIVRYNPIDKDDIENKANEKIDIEKKQFTMISIGRLSIQKGYDRLLKVVKKLNNDKLKFDLWIIGVGAEEEKLKKYIQENNLTNVKLLGYKSNPYKYINVADMFVCSSRAEGFSTVVSEAVILEKPIVTTECSGMREILGKNSEYGLICENNEEALYIALKDILSNKEKFNYYQNEVKTRKEIFDVEEAVKNIEELL